jgi:NDP-sugar pyrophosphorylase family protein
MKVVIPMAGLGKRFADAGYKDHKPLIKVNGKTLIQYTIESLNLPDAEYVFIIRDQGASYYHQIEEAIACLGIKYEIRTVSKLTSGAAETALIAFGDTLPSGSITAEMPAKYDGELIITNCDQYLEWDSQVFLDESRKYDASVLTYKSTDPKNSFIKVENDRVSVIKEKEAISDMALVGLHYWKHAQDFVRSAKLLIAGRTTSRETYVSETYNYLIKEDKEIGAIPIEPGRYYSTGTPEDLSVFKGVVMEYFVAKPNTYFFDLDGTILMHSHKYSNLKNENALCPGVKAALDEIDSRGDKIILCSARKESARELTVKVLEELMVPYDQLVLNVGQGCRIIVNDKLELSSKSRCRAVDVLTDKGWTAGDL